MLGDRRQRARGADVGPPAPDRAPRHQSRATGAHGPSGGPTAPGRGPGGWWAYAACRGLDPDLWFPYQGGSVRAAKRVCRACPVRLACLAEAVRRGELYGVWGGASEEERRGFRAAVRQQRDGGDHGRERAA
ncbi:WhiB family transcriptional regulator [Nocardiopsis sp. CC223A]|uniref:WhiB family transcriptional regulator n=1 Tax=Nocardiopsis sp. CC223A TaxID=3044051 RepID=UPI00278C80D7|nr:WhiB family transcriptional regulator [Nocardiopsis sp. CC223A]